MRLSLLLVALASLLMLAVACGSDDDAAPAAPAAPAAAAAPAATPTPLPPTLGDEPYELTIWVGGQGSSSYALGVGTGEIINKNHPWVRVRAIEQNGPEGMLTYEQQPDKRPYTLLSANQNDIGRYTAGLPPLSGPIEPPMALFNYAPNSSVGVVCADPEIKEITDLAGKKVAMGAPGGGIFVLVEALAKAAGMWDDVDIQTTASSSQARAAYIDGRIDCTSIGIIDQWTTSSAAEPMQTRGAYLLNHGSEELFAKAREESGIPMVPNAVCPGAFEEKLNLDYSPVQTRVNYVAYTPGYMAAPQVPQEVVYQLMRTIYDHRFEYKDFHKNGVYLENEMANMVVGGEYFHPGAIQLYDEEGIEYGVAGHEAQQKIAKAEGHGKVACL